MQTGTAIQLLDKAEEAALEIMVTGVLFPKKDEVSTGS